MNRIIKNYIYNVIYQVFLILVPIITAPYLSRVLGATQLGIYSYINSISSILTTIGLLGLNNYGIRQIAYVQNDNEARNRIFSEIMYARLILIIVVSIVYWLIIRDSEYYVYFIMQYFLIASIFIDVSWILIGLENMKVVVIRNSIAKFLTVIGIFIFVKKEEHLLLYISIFSIITFITTLSIYPYIKRYVRFTNCEIKKIFGSLKQSFYLFLPQVSILVYLQINKIMLKFLTANPSQLSFYDQAEKLVQIPLAVITALGLVMMPRLANEFKKNNNEAINIYIIQTIKFSLFLAIPMSIGIASIANWLIPWYLGKEFIPVIYAIIITSPIIIINSLVNISGNQYFTATNQVKILTISCTISALINIIINIILIPKFQYKGAATATLISSTILLIIQYGYMNRQIKILKALISSLKYIIVSGVMGVIVYIIGIKMGSSPITTIIQISIGMSIYLLILFLLRDEILLRIINEIKKILIRKRKE